MQVVNCAFLGNSAGNHGGALYISGEDTNPDFVNCLFSGNSVLGHGGAVTIADDAGATFTNCTFSGNSAPGEGAAVSTHSSAMLTNCIVWGNSPVENQIQVDTGGSVTISYSDIQEGWSGTENIDADPLFCDADGVDNTVGTLDDNLRLQDGSPCLEIGSDSAVPNDIADIDDDSNVSEDLPWDRDNEKPVTQWGRFFDVVNGPNASNVDMGTYENQHIAECPWDIASSGTPGPPPDGVVGQPDLNKLLADWGACPGCGADFDCDLVVNTADFLALMGNWGECSEGLQGGGGEEELLDALEILGYSSVAEYLAEIGEGNDEEVFAAAVVLAALLSGGG